MKKIIIPIIAAAVVVILGIIVILSTSNNKNNSIDIISINNIKINQKVTKKMKNMVMDADFSYMYNHIGFSVDDKDNINKIVFYSTVSKGKSYGINEAEVKCKYKRLKTVKDFNRVLGEGKVEKIDSSHKNIKYNDTNYELVLSVINDNIINIMITKK